TRPDSRAFDLRGERYMSGRITASRVLLAALALLGPFQPVRGQVVAPPTAKSDTTQPRRPDPPPLAGTGLAAQASVAAFLDWASNSTVAEHNLGLIRITEARQNAEIGIALCTQVFTNAVLDHSRALVALSVFGEMQSPIAEECLPRFVQLPLPNAGKVVEGEIVEQTALAILQAKAIEALAYRKTTGGDAAVFRAVAQHPSRIVRAAAIDAYLWNHGDSAEARITLS